MTAKTVQSKWNHLGCAVVMCVASSARASHCERYTLVVDSVNCFAPATIPSAIRDDGTVVGVYECTGSNPKPFVWLAGGHPTPIAVQPGMDWVDVHGMNVLGVIAGSSHPNSPTTYIAFREMNGQFVPLGHIPGGTTSEALGINDSSVIVGYDGFAELVAVRWVSNQAEVLSLPIGPSSVASDISNNGAVCGWMGDGWIWHAFVWKDGKAVEIGSTDGTVAGIRAIKINNAGDVVGLKPVPFGSGYVTRSWIWRNGVMTDLGTLPNQVTAQVLDFNDSDQAVGVCGSNQIFLWENGVMKRISDLEIVNPQAISFKQVYAINNAGQIAGTGSLPGAVSVAYVLTPVPPLMGDTNCDDAVNIDDLTNVILNWGSSDEEADVNESGVVDVADLMEVVGNWGPGGGKK